MKTETTLVFISMKTHFDNLWQAASAHIQK